MACVVYHIDRDKEGEKKIKKKKTNGIFSAFKNKFSSRGSRKHDVQKIRKIGSIKKKD